MALKEQDIVFTTTDEAGNTVIQMPITRVENVEDAVRTVNSVKPDKNGDVKIDIDMSHLATKEEVTQGLSKKREHTIQIANADLNTLLEDKTWACSGTLKNTPIACTFCIVQAYDTGAPVSGNIVQVCYIPNQTNNTVRAFWRNCLNGATFGAWTESSAVKTVNSITPDEAGNIDVPNATTSKFGLVRLAAEEDVLNEAPQTAVCTQLIYEINEFRRKSTAYQVGDKVDCAFQYERFLECTKAGTTSGELLDTRNVTHGQVITDGTAEWTVRTHIRSINNAVADASGNITPEQTGCLPLTGGTMSGGIKWDKLLLHGKGDFLNWGGNFVLNNFCTANGQVIAIMSGNAWNAGGASIYLKPTSGTEESGEFNLSASDSSGNFKTLLGRPDGQLSWDGKDVMRAFAPSSKRMDLGRPASGSNLYAPACGWVSMHATSQGTDVTEIRLHNNAASLFGYELSRNTSNMSMSCFVPVAKGDSVNVYYWNARLDWIIFVYAMGEQ